MPQFKPERIPEILGENLNPRFYLLNHNPSTASRSNKEDITTLIITWLTTSLLLLMIFVIFKVRLFKLG